MKKNLKQILRKSNTFTLIDDESDLNLTKVSLLGQGSYGEVWLVKDLYEKQFALKILNSTDSKKMAINQIRQEIQILQSLNHPNIVSFDQAFLLKDGRVFILMEFLEGGNLKEFIKERREACQGITDEEKTIIIKQIIEAIKYIHDNQIIHRDLKLENILLKRKNDISEVKIADFGISQKFDDNIGIHSNSQAGGTRSFMPPEIFNGQSYGKSVDIWSCGIILFMLCSNGRHPFINHFEPYQISMEKLKNPEFQFLQEEPTPKETQSEKTTPYRKVNRLSSCHCPEQFVKIPQQTIAPKQLGAHLKFRILQNFIDQKKTQSKKLNYSNRFLLKKPQQDKNLFVNIKKNETIEENFTNLSIDLIKKMCAIEPSMRYSLVQIQNHPWITRQNEWKIPLTNNELFVSFEKAQKFTQFIIAGMILEYFKEKGEKKSLCYINLQNQHDNKLNESANKFNIRKCKNKCLTTKNKLSKIFTPVQESKRLQVFQRVQEKHFSSNPFNQVKNAKYFIQQQQNKSAVSFYFQKLLNSNVTSNVNFAKAQLQKYCKRSLCFN